MHLRGKLSCASMDRINGWAEILKRFGDPGANIRSTLHIHARCARLINCIPTLQQDPHRPEDVLKIDADEVGHGGDDPADAFRYGISTKARSVAQRRLSGI
jgi:phage terminase large subunit